MSYRVGTGFDVHRFVPGRPLMLGGVAIPHAEGLLGHSDGDALLHALADALLGAAALGDLGRHFPDTDPRYAGADSRELLQHAARLVREKGWVPVNVDSTVIAERPRLGPHVPAMRAEIARLLELPEDSVSVKAKTHEGVDGLGRGEAIAVHAVVLLKAR